MVSELLLSQEFVRDRSASNAVQQCQAEFSVSCPFLDAVHHNERFEHPLLAENGVFSAWVKFNRVQFRIVIVYLVVYSLPELKSFWEGYPILSLEKSIVSALVRCYVRYPTEKRSLCQYRV